MPSVDPKSKILHLAGPTGAGKTALALALAARLDAEIVGADAFQIYRELPVLTAQPSAEERGRLPHHLVGSIPVSESFDVHRYAQLAGRAIDAVLGRGRTALVVGGTGLYFRALIDGLDPTPSASPELRAELAASSQPDLVARLARADADALGLVDLKNRRRVERAIEICELSGRPLSAFRQRTRRAPRGLLLVRDREELRGRIEHNVHAMLAGGAIEEVRATRGSAGPTASRAIGWREIDAHLRGELTLEECAAAMIAATRRYAKRQLTWFRNQTTFAPLDLTGTHDPSDAAEAALRALAVS